MKDEAQEKMGSPRAVHDISASSDSESDDDSDSSSSSASSGESDSSSSGSDSDKSSTQGDAGKDSSKNGEPNDGNKNDTSSSEDSESSSSDDSDSSSSDSDSKTSGSDSDSSSDESDSSDSSGDENKAELQSNQPGTPKVESKKLSPSKAEKIKPAPSSPNKTKSPKKEIKHEAVHETTPDSAQSTPQKLQPSSILEGIVKDPTEFSPIDAPGPFTVEDIDPENEYHIIRFPTGMLNPAQLPNTELSFGNRKSSVIEILNKQFEVMAYDHVQGPETPALFLPDKSGQLNQVDLEIKSQIVIRQPIPPVKSEGIVQVNIDDLRSKVHQPPEITERNFFARPEARKVTPKKKKLSKEEKKLLKKKKLSKEEKKLLKKEKLSKEMKKLLKKEKLSKEEKKLLKKEKLSKEEMKLLIKKKKELKKRPCNSEDSVCPSSSPKKKKKKEK